ncbi:MAG: hypothetical protein A2W91_08190 [Bacteroidetes bacterium GWF2_38_335]|nr:MAG: hypothetical protein A2W91_08190 [Bacteroidetes bacterium GWF2_38_335]OFY78976.1 MAG: hypothetical protein A2281_02530 [Bacteroidetes bacterium RIFOXYA12_FULL_38_20]HBS86047.1 hypothetical protein [Bacteroidales bacterium]
MKTNFLLTLVLLSISLFSQNRTEIKIPDIQGYFTLKGDFHVHTIFSDGTVWPEDRIKEAWRDGLDVIALTDHLEYSPHSKDVSKDKNRPHEIASETAAEYGIMLIRGGEITRSMPPGHLNAYFLNDVNKLNQTTFMKAIEAAADQKAFINWNHPGWKAQIKDTVKWYDIHTELYNKGWLNGIEIVNYHEYYPEVFQWAIDKNLTIFGNSDTHEPISFEYPEKEGKFRPVTLVFAKEKTLSGVREAFENHRTAVLFNDTLFGKEEYLKAIYEGSVKILNQSAFVDESKNIFIRFENSSSIPVLLKKTGDDADVKSPEFIKIPALTTIIVEFTMQKNQGKKGVKIAYEAQNWLCGPKTGLKINIGFDAINLNNPVLKSENNLYYFTIPGTGSEFDVRYSFDKGMKDGLCKLSEPVKKTGKFTLYYQLFVNNSPTGKVYERDLYVHRGVFANLLSTGNYSKKYDGGGSAGLVNGMLGSTNYRDGNWTGYEQEDAEIIMDLNKPVKTEAVSMNFLHAPFSWIFSPISVTLFVSVNGKDFEEVKTIRPEPTKESDETEIRTISFDGINKEIRYIKVSIKNIGLCPEWHTGSGKKAWFFIDEIIIN